jgi:hypothetical protein
MEELYGSTGSVKILQYRKMADESLRHNHDRRELDRTIFQ